MKHQLLLFLALNLLNHEIYNSQAARSSSTKESKLEIESKEEFLEFLAYFFDTKTGLILSAHLPEYQCTLVKNNIFKGRQINYLLHHGRSTDKKVYWSLIDDKQEISKDVFRTNCYRLSVPEIVKFLKILFCEEPGRAEFIDSKLTLRYHNEPTHFLSSEELQKEILVQQIALLKTLQQQRSMPKPMLTVPKLSRATQTELPAEQVTVPYTAI
ncbi:MAG TPA: hypothetical protein VLG50_01270 [Candidatus Saccharimonadales bacterium]|nr:hypothetical protein [Candidatus Saccharimonadales bacterium]